MADNNYVSFFETPEYLDSLETEIKIETEEEKIDELSQRPRNEIFEGLKSIPSKMRLRSVNQTKERAKKFLEGKTSGFYDSEFTKWKKANNITTTFKTPKDEYKKYVRQFLDDLEN